ncbi:unnamed protein product [Cylicocyclus nassatus]|uniref:Uncharacterized protein n=1 Tax=Cylicocyclus nassatus TaxID=53992 RepID=A0AA36MAJ5_CYLNA|nr:unnamed protein product [Cylicocyclus nassatus]
MGDDGNQQPEDTYEDLREEEVFAEEMAPAQPESIPLHRRDLRSILDAISRLALGQRGGAKRPRDQEAPRSYEGIALTAVANRLGLETVVSVISNTLQTDKVTDTIKLYKAQLERFMAWKES